MCPTHMNTGWDKKKSKVSNKRTYRKKNLTKNWLKRQRIEKKASFVTTSMWDINKIPFVYIWNLINRRHIFYLANPSKWFETNETKIDNNNNNQQIKATTRMECWCPSNCQPPSTFHLHQWENEIRFFRTSWWRNRRCSHGIIVIFFNNL